MNKFDIVLREKGFGGEAIYSYNSLKSTLKGMLGLNEDKYYIRDNKMGEVYSFSNFIDNYIFEEKDTTEDTYMEKLDWMAKNGWSFWDDEEELSDEDFICAYEENGYYWRKDEIKEFSLEDIKMYKAWYDGLISDKLMEEVFSDKFNN